jgi:hypothetical protein
MAIKAKSPETKWIAGKMETQAKLDIRAKMAQSQIEERKVINV